MTVIAKLGTLRPSGPFPAINNEGQVAFAARDFSSNDFFPLFADFTPEVLHGGVFVGDGISLTRITSDVPASLDINDHGWVAWSSSEGVFVGDGSWTSLLAPFGADLSLSTPFIFGGNIAINERGTVLFEAIGPAGLGIYEGTERVIGAGDLLFGSMVTGIDFFTDGLNNRGQIAFEAYLADGRTVIARGSPVPEPSTLVLLGSGLAGLGGLVWRRHCKG